MRSSNPVLSRPDAFTPQQQPAQGGFQQPYGYQRPGQQSDRRDDGRHFRRERFQDAKRVDAQREDRVAGTIGYYDGSYGAYRGGYWGSDGYFYYADAGMAYRRDDARHFRTDPYGNAQVYEVALSVEDGRPVIDANTVYYNNAYGPYYGGYWGDDG